MSYKLDISLESLFEAGCHFGHTTVRFNPKTKPYVYTVKNKVVIFDLAQTRQKLIEAAEFLFTQASLGGEIIFVGTKRQAADVIKEEANKAGVYYVNSRWLGGMLTNWAQIKDRIKFLEETEEQLEKGDFSHYTKLEKVRLERRLKRLRRFLGGLIGFSGKPAAIVVTDVKKDVTAVREAKQMGVPVVAIVDSNIDPDWVDYPIPANDDAIASIKLIVEKLAEAVIAGKQAYDKKAPKSEAKDTEKTKQVKKTNKSKEAKNEGKNK